MDLKNIPDHILAGLCIHDPRNPDFDPERSEDQEPCYKCDCDNCFYGRHEIVDYFLTFGLE